MSELEKKLVRAPAKEKLDLLKKCSSCVFVGSCLFLPNGESCKTLLGKTDIKNVQIELKKNKLALEILRNINTAYNLTLGIEDKQFKELGKKLWELRNEISWLYK